MISTAFGLVVLAGALWLFLSSDEPPPDVRDFNVKPLKLSDDENACAFVARATALVKASTFRNEETKIGEMLTGKAWDAALVRQWLNGTDEIWALWEQAARTPQGQIPLNTDPRYPSLSPTLVLDLHQLAQLRAWDLARSGDPEGAIQSLFSSLQVAQRLQQSRGKFIFYLVGTGIKRTSQDSLRAIALEFKPSATILRQILQQLEAARPDEVSFANGLKSEFRFLDDSLEDLKKQSASDSGFWADLALRTGLQIPRFYKPNQTHRIFAEAIRKDIGAIDHAVGTPGQLRTAEYAGIAQEGMIFSNNLIGRLLLRSGSWVEESNLLFRLKEQSNLSANEAFFALWLYHREHGELPVTLDALVPGYLPAVPRDYLDGQPIRYSRTLRAVWSVGFHHFNVTGHAPATDEIKDEICLPLDFAAPPATSTLPAANSP